jgi:hypothetical protein
LRVNFNASRFGRQIDGGQPNTWHFEQGFFNACDTRGAGHAADADVEDVRLVLDLCHGVASDFNYASISLFRN